MRAILALIQTVDKVVRNSRFEPLFSLQLRVPLPRNGTRTIKKEVLPPSNAGAMPAFLNS